MDSGAFSGSGGEVLPHPPQPPPAVVETAAVAAAIPGSAVAVLVEAAAAQQRQQQHKLQHQQQQQLTGGAVGLEAAADGPHNNNSESNDSAKSDSRSDSSSDNNSSAEWWRCTGCWVMNSANDSVCPCCEAVKPGATESKQQGGITVPALESCSALGRRRGGVVLDAAVFQQQLQQAAAQQLQHQNVAVGVEDEQSSVFRETSSSVGICGFLPDPSVFNVSSDSGGENTSVFAVFSSAKTGTEAAGGDAGASTQHKGFVPIGVGDEAAGKTAEVLHKQAPSESGFGFLPQAGSSAVHTPQTAAAETGGFSGEENAAVSVEEEKQLPGKEAEIHQSEAEITALLQSVHAGPLQAAPALTGGVDEESSVCATPAASVYMFGSGEMDQLPFWQVGEEGDREVARPRLVQQLQQQFQIVHAACGAMHSAALAADGSCFTFGCGDGGALGRVLLNSTEEACALNAETPPREFAHFPGKVPLKEFISTVACGDSHTAFLTRAGSLYICGSYRDSYGTLGFPEISSSKDFSNEAATTAAAVSVLSQSPVPVCFFKTCITAVACGENHTVALERGGCAVYFWGSNEFGQLAVHSAAAEASVCQAANVAATADENGGEQSHLSITSNTAEIEETTKSEKLLLLRPQRRTLAALKLFLSTSPAAGFGQAEPSTTSKVERVENVFCGRCTTFLWSSVRTPEEEAAEATAAPATASAAQWALFGCGRNSQGEVGCDAFSQQGGQSQPAVVCDFKEVTALRNEKLNFVGGGQFFSVALTENGQLFTWGQTEYTGHEMPLAPSKDKNKRLLSICKPTLLQFPGNAKIRFARCGSDHCLAITSTGCMYTWGAGQNFQLGNQKDLLVATRPYLVDPALFNYSYILEAHGGSQHSMVLVWNGQYASLTDEKAKETAATVVEKELPHKRRRTEEGEKDFDKEPKKRIRRKSEKSLATEITEEKEENLARVLLSSSSEEQREELMEEKEAQSRQKTRSRRSSANHEKNGRRSSTTTTKKQHADAHHQKEQKLLTYSSSGTMRTAEDEEETEKGKKKVDEREEAEGKKEESAALEVGEVGNEETQKSKQTEEEEAELKSPKERQEKGDEQTEEEEETEEVDYNLQEGGSREAAEKGERRRKKTPASHHQRSKSSNSSSSSEETETEEEFGHVEVKNLETVVPPRKSGGRQGGGGRGGGGKKGGVEKAKSPLTKSAGRGRGRGPVSRSRKDTETSPSGGVGEAAKKKKKKKEKPVGVSSSAQKRKTQPKRSQKTATPTVITAAGAVGTKTNKRHKRPATAPSRVSLALARKTTKKEESLAQPLKRREKGRSVLVPRPGRKTTPLVKISKSSAQQGRRVGAATTVPPSPVKEEEKSKTAHKRSTKKAAGIGARKKKPTPLVTATPKGRSSTKAKKEETPKPRPARESEPQQSVPRKTLQKKSQAAGAGEGRKRGKTPTRGGSVTKKAINKKEKAAIATAKKAKAAAGDPVAETHQKKQSRRRRL